MSPATRRAALTLLSATLLGTLVLGLGGRLAMHAVARLDSGNGGFTLGGTLTVIGLGAASGALGGVILWLARTLLRRWPPLPSLVYWGALALLALRGLRPLDAQRLLLFLPLVAGFGALLQWRTWPLRAATGGSGPG
jgi:hypothetical protein